MTSIIDIGALADLLQDAAIKEIRPRFRRLDAGDIRAKSEPTDLVTEADEAAERYIRSKIASLAPNALFVGEESVAADPALPPGGIDAAWESGGLRYDPAAVERAVAGLCDRALSALSAEHDLFTDTESTASWPH